MVKYMVDAGIVNATEYLGIVEFGTETFHSNSNVTFSVTDYNISINSLNNTPVSTPFSSDPTKNVAAAYIPNIAFLLATLALTLYL
jgi:xyloglucan-specific endo-beta-1,4-glucanase